MIWVSTLSAGRGSLVVGSCTFDGRENMNRDAIERAERIAATAFGKQRLAEALAEAKQFERKQSLSVPKRGKVKRYEFTEAQMQIAIRALDAEDPV